MDGPQPGAVGGWGLAGALASQELEGSTPEKVSRETAEFRIVGSVGGATV